MGLRRRLDRSLPKQEISPEAGLLQDLLPRIAQGRVIPVISNAFHLEEIFRIALEGTTGNDQRLSIDQQLTRVWADDIGYPAADNHNLARVAKFFITEQLEDVESAKSKYLAFLANILLAFAEDENPDDVELLSNLKASVQARKFSEIARALDYPRFRYGMEDPLRLLARLPMPAYITTSYFDFMERALEAEGKRPRTQVIFWSGKEYATKDEHKNDPNFVPTADNPAIYHLFGLEDYPRTLVISEDDYLNFLISISVDKDTQNPAIPLHLREGLMESVLLLLGFNAQEWELKILDTLIQQYSGRGTPRRILTQAKFTDNTGDDRKIIQYVSQYFDQRNFSVEWTGAEEFILRVWDEWKNWTAR